MSSTIGKLMVDMLIESATYIEDIMSFFNIFVKLNDFSTAKAFRVQRLVQSSKVKYIIINLVIVTFITRSLT